MLFVKMSERIDENLERTVVHERRVVTGWRRRRRYQPRGVGRGRDDGLALCKVQEVASSTL